MVVTHYFRRHEFHVVSPKIKPTKDSQDSKSSIEEISIRFAYQSNLLRLRYTEDCEEKILREESHPKVPLRYHKLNVNIFKEGDGSLCNYLSKWLSRYGLTDNIQIMADEIIAKWIQIKETVSSTFDRKVFPLFVDLKILNIVVICERCTLIREMEESTPELLYDEEEDDNEDCGMIPASETAARELLKKVEIEEEERCSHCDQSPRRKRRRLGIRTEDCSICLEEIKDERLGALQMPCSHFFHGECIQTWLKKSHYCPICRFQMPTS